MKDSYGDKIAVGTEDEFGKHHEVFLEVNDRLGNIPGKALAGLSPKGARKLAKKLLKAADVVEAQIAGAL